MKEMDFLERRSDLAIRKELRGIRDSYHHYWDLLAELLQNSRDAITRKKAEGFPGPFFIRIEVNASSNRLEVLDNGVGISSARMAEMLAPGGGDKEATSGEVGEKGVGLTYAVFSGNVFDIESRVVGSTAAGGTVRNACTWLNGGGVDRPTFEVADGGTSEPTHLDIAADGTVTRYDMSSYTKIAVAGVPPPENDAPVFAMTAEQLRVLLRTRTAVGVTTAVFDEGAPSEFDTYLVVTHPTSVVQKIDSSFLAPHTLVKKSDIVTYREVSEHFVAKTEKKARTKYLHGRTVWHSESVKVDGWDVAVYGVMFPENGTFQQLSRDVLHIVAEGANDEDDNGLFSSGIYVATKGMPTGMKIPPQPGGRYPAYYKRCFFLVESPNLKFDLGRKSLHYKYTGRLQEAVASVFKKFEAVAVFQGEEKAASAEPRITKAERDAKSQEEWALALKLAELGEPKLPYQKIPNKQEAAVAAVFHEMLGAGLLKGYKTLTTGYTSLYDLHAQYHEQGKAALKIIVEFKHSLESLVADFRDENKYFADINLLVAWDADQQKLKDGGFDLQTVASPEFDGVTHLLEVPVPGIEPIPVILLRTFIDRRKSST